MEQSTHMVSENLAGSNSTRVKTEGRVAMRFRVKNSFTPDKVQIH